MASELIMPQLGLTMTEGTVSQWLKREGDVVKKGEEVVERWKRIKLIISLKLPKTESF